MVIAAYRPDQRVRLRPAAWSSAKAGDYVVVRVMPVNAAGVRQYVVKGVSEAAGRVVDENQLSPCGDGPDARFSLPDKRR